MLPIWLTDTVTNDLDRAIHYTLLWGLEGVELRTVGGPGERVPHVNEEKLKRRLADNELPAISVVPGMFEGPASDRLAWLNELASFEETLTFCKRIGCACVVVSAFAGEENDVSDLAIDAFRRAGKAAARHDIRVAVLNEVASAFDTGSKLATLLTAVNESSVMAAWDPSVALQSGEDPQVGLEALGNRVALVRCSDGEVRNGTWNPVPLGEGSVGWASHFRVLRRLGFDGPVSMDLQLKPGPKHGLHEASRLLQLMRQSR